MGWSTQRIAQNCNTTAQWVATTRAGLNFYMMLVTALEVLLVCLLLMW